MERDQDERRRQWRLLARFYEGFLPQLPEGWEQPFKDAVGGISVVNRVHLLNCATACAGDWDTTPAITRDIRDMIIETIPLDQRHLVPSLGHCQVDAHEATQAENQEGRRRP